MAGDNRAPLGAIRDLCIDVANPERAARFWSATLGLRGERAERGWVLRDAVPEHTVWLNSVPDLRPGKRRVHLDVHVASVADLVALGARVDAEFPHWTVLLDPEDGELCAFPREREALPDYRLYEVVVDSANPHSIAGWWAGVLGATEQCGPEGDFCWLEGAPGQPWPLVFVGVPEPKVGHNSVHWDLAGDPGRLVAAGARLLRRRDEEIHWDILADPEGNEFCVFART